MKLLITPSLIFSLIWIIIIAIQLLEPSIFIIDNDLLLLFSMLIFFPIILINALDFILVKSDNYNFTHINVIKSRMQFFSIVFIFLSLFELLFFKNLPFLSAIGIGPFIDYTSYGFPGLHGFLNGIQLALISLYTIKINITKKGKKILFLLFIWALLLFSRQLMLSCVLYFLFTLVAIRYNGVLNLKDLLKTLIISIGIILLFGFLGGIRNNTNNLFHQIGLGDDSTILYSLPVFQWAFIYLISPIFNLLNNLSITGDPYTLILSPLFPSPIRSMLNLDELELYLAIPQFNVGTMFPRYIASFGIVGVSLVSSIVGFISIYLRRKSIGRIGVPLFVYSCHWVLLSFFADFFINLPFLLAMLCSSYSIKKNMKCNQ